VRLHSNCRRPKRQIWSETSLCLPCACCDRNACTPRNKQGLPPALARRVAPSSYSSHKRGCTRKSSPRTASRSISSVWLCNSSRSASLTIGSAARKQHNKANPASPASGPSCALLPLCLPAVHLHQRAYGAVWCPPAAPGCGDPQRDTDTLAKSPASPAAPAAAPLRCKQERPVGPSWQMAPRQPAEARPLHQSWPWGRRTGARPSPPPRLAPASSSIREGLCLSAPVSPAAASTGRLPPPAMVYSPDLCFCLSGQHHWHHHACCLSPTRWKLNLKRQREVRGHSLPGEQGRR
jgi:hypothetical protein